MRRFINSLKESLALLGIVLIITAVIGGIGFIKYKIWRAEHPQAKTWTFFIPKSR